MVVYFPEAGRVRKEMHPGVLRCPLHRYGTGGGAALFRLEPGAEIPEHDHPSGEHGYVTTGTGVFGDRTLSAGDGLQQGRREPAVSATERPTRALQRPMSMRAVENAPNMTRLPDMRVGLLLAVGLAVLALGCGDDGGAATLAPPHDAAIDGGDSGGDRKSTRLNSSHLKLSRMPSSA